MKTLFKLTFASLLWTLAQAAEIFVSPTGQDQNPGTATAPVATLAQAQKLVRASGKLGKKPIFVTLTAGTYYLPETLVFRAEDSGTVTAPVVYRSQANEKAVVSGGQKLALKWEPYRDGIFKATVPADLQTEEIFLNGERQILARYPNFDPQAKYFNGYAADAWGPERAARWANPKGGYFHAMHPALWGGFTWRITGKNDQGEVTKEGGWQNNRGGAVHDKIRFVENIFEELDAPQEWFLDQQTHTLYYYPPAGLDLRNAVVEATRLRSLIEFRGTEAQPVRSVRLLGLIFRHAERTVMETKEPLLRTDWAIYRGGALYFEGTEDCGVEDSSLDQLGGNAIFVNHYNRRVTVRRCEIAKAGASGVCFVGDPQAARNPLFNYGQSNTLTDLDRTPGSKTNNYPAQCLVEDCLIYLTGRVEKQTAGINIDLAQDITVRHCSIYDMPRAGINIGDGCWGGHVIEFCDVFDTVKETGDHGSFNSWGRDRFWNLKGVDLGTVTLGPDKGLPLLDVVKTVTLRNNRWRCEHGWDIDLDDGSTNYLIENNLCLNGGLKNREGFFRTVRNNIMVNNSFHPHVWYGNSKDVFEHNIVFTDYRPVGLKAPWGELMDHNLLHKVGAAAAPALSLQKQSGHDENSLMGDAQFVDPASGNFQVKEGSPALRLGFQNFPMDQFGVMTPALRAKRRVPSFDSGKTLKKRDASVSLWREANVRNIADEGEMSVYGTPGLTGVLVVELPPGSELARLGVQKEDVILGCDGARVESVADLLMPVSPPKKTTGCQVKILRKQKEILLSPPTP